MTEQTNKPWKNEKKANAICLSWQIKIKRSQQMLLHTQRIATFLLWIYSVEKWSKIKPIWFMCADGKVNAMPFCAMLNACTISVFSPFEHVAWQEGKCWLDQFPSDFFLSSLLLSFADVQHKESFRSTVERAYWPLFIFQCFIFGCYLNLLFVCACVSLLIM